MACSLAFISKLQQDRKKKQKQKNPNQQQHREIRSENGEMRSRGQSASLTPQHGAQIPRDLRGGARGPDAWVRLLWLRECRDHVGAPETQASRQPPAFSFILHLR